MTLAYVTPEDMLVFRDEQFIGELITDDRTSLTTSEILANDKLTSVLETAEGEVFAALLSGGRYTPTTLALINDSSKRFLVKVICIVAFADLLDRRPEVNLQAADAYRKMAGAYLDDLRKGRNLFNQSDNGTLNAATVRTDAPTVVEYESLNTIPDRMPRHLPPRSDTMPLGRGQY